MLPEVLVTSTLPACDVSWLRSEIVVSASSLTRFRALMTGGVLIVPLRLISSTPPLAAYTRASAAVKSRSRLTLVIDTSPPSEFATPSSDTVSRASTVTSSRACMLRTVTRPATADRSIVPCGAWMFSFEEASSRSPLMLVMVTLPVLPITVFSRCTSTPATISTSV